MKLMCQNFSVLLYPQTLYSMIRKIKSFTFIIILLSFQNIHAIQSEYVATIDSLHHKEIDEVHVSGLSATKLNLPYDEITQADIFNRGFHSTADALLAVSGIDMSRDGTWATTILMRGLPESKTVFLSNGDRMLTATDLAGVLSTIDFENLEKIEVIKGAGSVLYGTGAMGGIVNFVSKRPFYTDKSTLSGNVSTGFHTVNQLWTNQANFRVSNRDWYLALDGSYRTANNTTTPIGKIPNSQFNDASFGVLAGIQYDDNQEFIINYKYFHAWDVGLPGGNVFPETARVKYLNFNRNQLNGEYIYKDVSDVIKQVNIKAYTQNIKRNVENIVSESQAIFPGSVNATSGLQATTDLYFNDYETMTVGVEGWYRDQQTSRIRINSIALDTTVVREQPTPKASMLDVGLFAQHKWVIDPKYWTVNTGVRLDFIQTANDTAFKEIAKYHYVNGEKVELTPNKTILFDKNSHNQFAYAAHIDVEYKPLTRHKLILSLANAYRVASLEERFKYIDQAGDLRVGNPNLKPEKGLFSNLSYAFTGEKFIFKTDIFGNYLFDLIAEKQGVYHAPNGTSYNAWISTNIDRAYFVGGELEFLWLIVRNLDFDFKVSYVYAADAKTQKHLPRIPPLFGGNTLSYQLNKIALLYAEMDWDLEMRDVLSGMSKPLVLTTLFNLGFETKPISIAPVKLTFAGGIHNIFDTTFADPMSTLRGINKLEPGRNVFVKVRVGF